MSEYLLMVFGLLIAILGISILCDYIYHHINIDLYDTIDLKIVHIDMYSSDNRYQDVINIEDMDNVEVKIRDGMVLYDGKESREYSWSKSHFYFVDKPCEKRNPGYPLDSMSIMPECNKYFVDLTEEDRNKNKENYKEDDVIDFIVNNV